jgi:ABC-type Mn2+/Zn2+ transport system permease subunit
LVSAFLILPSNIAKIVAKNTAQWNSIWVGTALTCSIVALFISWYFDTPSWASIVWCMVVVYGGMRIWSLSR